MKPGLRVVKPAAIIVLLALGAAGCASLAPRPIAPEVALESIAAMGVGAAGALARVRLSVSNPNGYDLAVQSLDYTITIDDRRLGAGSLAHPVTLVANAQTPVDVDIVTDLAVLGNALDRALRRGALPYRLEGAIVLAGGLRLPFLRRGDFDPLRGLAR
jgi:LEA14-like dessication related protein